MATRSLTRRSSDHGGATIVVKGGRKGGGGSSGNNLRAIFKDVLMRVMRGPPQASATAASSPSFCAGRTSSRSFRSLIKKLPSSTNSSSLWKTASSTLPPPLLDDVKYLVSECATEEEARRLLIDIVSDLLCEVGDQKQRLEEAEEEVRSLQNELGASQKKVRDTLRVIIKAINKSRRPPGMDDTYSSSPPISLTPTLQQSCSNGGGSGDDEKRDPSHDVEEEVDMPAIQPEVPFTAEQVTELVVTKLTREVQGLSLDKSCLIDQIQGMREELEDLESQKQAAELKIEALERQFTTINENRQNVVTKLMEGHGGSPTNLRDRSMTKMKAANTHHDDSTTTLRSPANATAALLFGVPENNSSNNVF